MMQRLIKACHRQFYYLSVLVLLFSFVSVLPPLKADALSGNDFQAGRIIDDSIFVNSNALSVQDIQNFLNSKVPSCDTNGTQLTSHPNGSGGYYTRAQWGSINGNPAPFTCLKDYVENVSTLQNNFHSPATPVPGGISAAQIIWNAAQQYQINPEVLITTLQKEQGLVTDDWPWYGEFQYAMGYSCPDTSAGCDTNYADFYKQVDGAAFQYRYYLNHPGAFNYWVGNNFIRYNTTGSGCQYGANVNIQNAATAALYIYTPYTPDSNVLNHTNQVGSSAGPGPAINDICATYGNRNFWWYFNAWFGSSTGCGGSATLPTSTSVVLSDTNLGFNPYFIINSGSSTGCVEVHGWKYSFTNWVSHIATNMPSIDSNDWRVMTGDLNGDGTPEFILVGYRNTGSGMVEFHVWDPSLQKWTAHIASNLPAVDPANSTIKFADLDGDGKDEAILTIFNGTGSGKVEFHVWAPGMKSWKEHIASNLSSIPNPQDFAINFADFGTGHDQAVLSALHATGSGMVEFHIWQPHMQAWQNHIVSNLGALANPADFGMAFADVNGRHYDQAVLEALRNTGSGNIEFHIWQPSFQVWQNHIASNQKSIQ